MRAGVVAGVLCVVAALLVLNARTARGHGEALERAVRLEAVVVALTVQLDTARSATVDAVVRADAQRERYARDSIQFERWREVERDVAQMEARRADALSDSLVLVLDSASAVVVREIQAAHTEERRAWANERSTYEAERAQLFGRIQTVEELAAAVTVERDIQAEVIGTQRAEVAALRRLADPPLWDRITAELTDPSLFVGLGIGVLLATVIRPAR